MADWTIRIAQLPVAPVGTRFNHNMIVVMDPSGRVVWELNGGPVGPDGAYSIAVAPDWSRMKRASNDFMACMKKRAPVESEPRFMPTAQIYPQKPALLEFRYPAHW
jgi:hypothetical protein